MYFNRRLYHWLRYATIALCTFCAYLPLAHSSIQDAKRLDKEGMEAYEAGDFGLAIEKFREAITMIPHPVLMIRLADAYFGLEDFRGAKESCEMALQSELVNPEQKQRAKKCIHRASQALSIIQAELNSTPEGAILRIDGVEVGDTPWRGILKPGRRQLDFELEGYNTTTRILTPTAGERIRFKVIMIPKGLGGLLSVRSTPEGANILLEQKFIGKTPLISYPISSGAHSMQIIHRGYLSETRNFTISEGQNLEQALYLRPERGNLSAQDLWPAWGLLGASALTASLGGYFGYEAYQSSQEADSLARTNGLPEFRSVYDRHVSDMENSRDASDVLWVTTGVLFTSGLTWLLISL